MTNPLSEYATALRENGEYSGDDLAVLESALEEKVAEIEGDDVQEKQEQLRKGMNLASEQANKAVEEGEESKDRIRLSAKTETAKKQDQLREELTR